VCLQPGDPRIKPGHNVVLPNPLRSRIVCFLNSDFHLLAEPFVVLGSLVASLHTDGLIRPAASSGIRLVGLSIDFEARNTKFITNKGCGGSEIAPQARLVGPLGCNGALKRTVTHEDSPAARLAEHSRSADGMGFDKALDSLSIDDIGGHM
jgi:hypothetical protein